jgi:hypothetical protein
VEAGAAGGASPRPRCDVLCQCHHPSLITLAKDRLTPLLEKSRNAA